MSWRRASKESGLVQNNHFGRETNLWGDAGKGGCSMLCVEPAGAVWYFATEAAYTLYRPFCNLWWLSDCNPRFSRAVYQSDPAVPTQRWGVSDRKGVYSPCQLSETKSASKKCALRFVTCLKMDEWLRVAKLVCLSILVLRASAFTRL